MGKDQQRSLLSENQNTTAGLASGLKRQEALDQLMPETYFLALELLPGVLSALLVEDFRGWVKDVVGVVIF